MTTELLESRPSFTQGIYGIPESARYLLNTQPLSGKITIPTNRLRYWIRTSVPPIREIEFPARQHVIDFPHLISMRMVAVLRSRNISLRDIKNTEQWLREEFKIPYPLASKGLWTYGHGVYIKFEQHILAASKFGQQAMMFIGEWLNKVDLDMTFAPNEIADSWLVHRYVRLNPRIQLGEPCIDGTRIPTNIIWSKHVAGDIDENIARAHDISITQVEAALDWERRIVAT